MRVLVGLVLAALLAGCQAKPPTPVLSPVERAAAYLKGRQSPDGSWKSQLYRDMGSGLELTPFTAKALLFSNLGAESARRGLEFIQSAKDPQLFYPVYTSAGVLLLMSHGAELNPTKEKQAPWLKRLDDLQLTQALGWAPGDPDFGGWGYAMHGPHKPDKTHSADPMGHSNLSSTTFALGGLGVAGVGAQDARVQAALTFVRRCQNGDGGFFASPTDLVLNKAGESSGKIESYGSASSDGLRCLLRCGLPVSDPAVVSARHWLVSNFNDQSQPGHFPEARYLDRDSLLYYYFWSTAHALGALQRAGSSLTPEECALAQRMCERLQKLQGPDGSWHNPAGASREDDPLVATPMAMAVLVLAQGMR